MAGWNILFIPDWTILDYFKSVDSYLYIVTERKKEKSKRYLFF